ncbi:MAG: VWA domain-containing protein [Magnetococcales bacterium]|nr:VWA domain-containing protein [Magnetococcales bacterium]
MIEGFHWLRPWWLAGLLLVPGLWWWLRTRAGQTHDWHRVCDAHLLPRLLRSTGSSLPHQRGVWVILLVSTLSLLALAGPAWHQLPQPVYQSQSALVLMLDLSQSMEATDLTPSRLERARLKIADLLHQRREGSVGLIAFAGQAFTVTPLTTDGETIRAHLHALSTEIMPVAGSRPDLAITLAGQMLKQAGHSQGSAWLIGDAPGADQTVELAKQFHRQGYRLSVLGVGTPDGAPIRRKQGGFLHDARGQIVLPRLDEAALRTLATAGGGDYARITTDDGDLHQLLHAESTNHLTSSSRQMRVTADRWQEEGPWLLLVVIPLAALGFRRGVLVWWLVWMIQPPALASEWDSFWQRPDQQGARMLAADQPDAAARLFTDPAWKAAAHYRAGEFAEALTAWQSLDHADSWYNRGNALAQLQRLEEAVQAYDAALKRNPDHADARYNRDLIQQQLQQKPKESSQSNQSSQSAQKESPSAPNPPSSAAQEGEKGEPENTKTQLSNVTSQKEETAEANAPPEQTTPSTDSQPTPTASEQEAKQAEAQWLQRIPDDPGGLLRRKFQYQYQRRGTTKPEVESW